MSEIDYQEDGAIATITIVREHKMNALSPAAMYALREALERLERSDDVRVGIVTGVGERAFCAGADIDATRTEELRFAASFLDRRVSAEHPLYIRHLAIASHGYTKPLIAAVNGVAVGGGMELVLNCDIAIASENARFGLPEVCIGSIPAAGGIQRLIRSLPRPVAMKFLLTGEIIDARQALAAGMVVDVVPAAELMASARAIAEKIAANAPLAVRAARHLAEKAHAMSLQEALELEELVWGHLYVTRDRREGRAAFVEKRKPQFGGE